MSCAAQAGEVPARMMYSCSGNADVGELADRVFRSLRNEGYGNGSCAAAVGLGLPNYLEAAKKAGELLVIDGCSVNCGKKMFERAGLSPRVVTLTEDFHLEKGKSPAHATRVMEIAQRIREGARV